MTQPIERRGAREPSAETTQFKPSKIKIDNPKHTLDFVRQVALSDGKDFQKATNGDIYPLLERGSSHYYDYAYEKQEDSCVLRSDQNNLRIIGHYDKKNHGISVSMGVHFRDDMSVDKTPREVEKNIEDALVAKFKDKFGLAQDSSGAFTIVTPDGFIFALNSFSSNLTSSSASANKPAQVFGSFEFAISTAKIKERFDWRRERIADFQDDRIVPVTADNIQQYFDNVTLVYDEARKIFETFGIKLPAIEAEIISRPKKEAKITDNIRASLGEVSENFAIRDPKVRFKDVIGHEHIVTQLRDIINALKDPQAKHELLDLPSGILLHGRPGCGKTYLAEAVAGESECKFLYIQPSMLFDEPQAKDIIRILFEEMKEGEKPTIVFVDEAETFFPRRELLSQQRAEVVSTFLANLDGVGRNHKAFLMLASNRAELIDPAMHRSGRIDYPFEVKPPTQGDRMRLFRHFISLVGNPGQDRYDPRLFDPNIFRSEEGITELSTKAGSFTQADIRTVVNRVLFKRWSTKGRPSVSLNDLLQMTDELRNSRIST